MKRIVAFMMICVSICLVMGCAKPVDDFDASAKTGLDHTSTELPNEPEQDSSNEEPLPSLEERAATIVEGMTYAEIKALMEDEGWMIGSGMMWYEWILSEDLVLWIWLANPRDEFNNLLNVSIDEYVVTSIEICEKDEWFLSRRARGLTSGMTYSDVQRWIAGDGTYVGFIDGEIVYEWTVAGSVLRAEFSAPEDEENAAYPDDLILNKWKYYKKDSDSIALA